MAEIDPELREAMECPEERILLRIGAASEPALHGLLLNPSCNRHHVLRILRRRPLPESVIRRIVESSRWMTNQQIRSALANHPSTGAPIGLGLVGHLFWRDLAQVAANPHVAPRVRRKAEQLLVLRAGEFTLGERIALARLAPRGVIAHLRREEDPGVVRALLENSRITEEDVLAIASQSSSPAVLRCLGDHPQWGRRYAVRMALLENRRIPAQIALRILPELPRRDVEAIARRLRAARIVRVAARRLLAERRREARTGRRKGS